MRVDQVHRTGEARCCPAGCREECPDGDQAGYDNSDDCKACDHAVDLHDIQHAGHSHDSLSDSRAEHGNAAAGPNRGGKCVDSGGPSDRFSPGDPYCAGTRVRADELGPARPSGPGRGSACSGGACTGADSAGFGGTRTAGPGRTRSRAERRGDSEPRRGARPER